MITLICNTCEATISGTDQADAEQQARARRWERGETEGWYCRACRNWFEGYARACEGV